MNAFTTFDVDLAAEQSDMKSEALTLIGSQIRDPDMYLNMMWMDTSTREDWNVPHPFPGQRSPKWQGCYLMIDNGVAVYVGRSANLAIRMHQHWNSASSSCFGDDYWGMVDDGEKGLFGVPFAAIWLIHDETERKNFEHLLIGTFRPLLNRL